MGVVDLLKSERGLLNLLYLGVLAALLLTGAPADHIQTWALYAGGTTGIYTVAKSIRPNDPLPKTPVVHTGNTPPAGLEYPSDE